MQPEGQWDYQQAAAESSYGEPIQAWDSNYPQHSQQFEPPSATESLQQERQWSQGVAPAWGQQAAGHNPSWGQSSATHGTAYTQSTWAPTQHLQV